MKTKAFLLRFLSILFGLLFLISLADPVQAGTPQASPTQANAPGIPQRVSATCTTSISGTLSSSTTWTKAHSPYCLTDNLTVAQGATLTLNPGVKVMAALQTVLLVQGSLIANGIASQPIIFTSLLDDGAGQWVGLVINGSDGQGKGTLDYVTIRDGGQDYYDQYDNLEVTGGAVVSFTHGLIQASAGDGVFVDETSQITFQNNTVQNNAAYPLNLPADVLPAVQNNIFNGNHPDRVLVAENDWEKMGASATWHVANGSGVYELANNLTVNQDAILTLEPGVTVLARPTVVLEVYGSLNAVGSSVHPVVFTSVLDSGPGQWVGLVFNGSDGQGTGTLDYVTLRNGGEDYYDNYDDLEVTWGANVTFTHGLIQASSGYGVWVDETSSLTFENNQVQGSHYAPLWVDSDNLAAIDHNTFTGNGTDQIRSGSNPLNMTFATVLSNTNQVDSYELEGDLTIGPNGSLSVDPGVTVKARNGTQVTINGSLNAVGTASQPILFTASAPAPQPGWWKGVWFEGTPDQPAQGKFDNASVEYAGAVSGDIGVNLYADDANVSFSNGSILGSQGDGFYVNSEGEHATISGSQIIQNSGFGVHNNDPANAVMAVNNWWGAASGPQTSSNCNVGGTGSLVSDGVVFSPFLQSYSAQADPLAPPAIGLVEIKPTLLYVPADGTSQAWVEVTVRDKDGTPLPGQLVGLSTTLGSLYNDDVTTGADGTAWTFLTSPTAGTATITASSGGRQGACSPYVQPASTQITFTGGSASDLFPDEEAPYMNSDIEVQPEPVTQGVPSKILLHIHNPYTQAITISGSVAYAQYGIGLVFGPIQAVSNWVVQPGQDGVFSIDWTPPISGHFCLTFDYSYVGGTAETPGKAQPQAKKSGTTQTNYDSQPAPLLRKGSKTAAQKAQKSIALMGDGNYAVMALSGGASGIPVSLIQDQGVGNILDFNFDVWGAVNCALAGGEDCGGWKGPRLQTPGGGFGNLLKDPPSQDYQQIATADPITFTPIQPSASMPAGRAAALNDVTSASLTLDVNLMAAVVSSDRYSGAAEANDTDWASQQANAFTYYLNQTAQAAITLADMMDALKQEILSEGFTDMVVSAADYQAYQARLKATGFTADELTAAHLTGLTDDTIEQIRQRRIAQDPTLVAGSQMAAWTAISEALRDFGEEILAPVWPGGVPGAPTAMQSTINRVLIQPITNTFLVGNPTDHTAVVTLQVKPVDMPIDWTVALDVQAITLEPGQQVTVTVTTTPGSLAVQGTQLRVAIEGYIDGNLIGGVVQDVVVPKYVYFTPPPWKIYLPMISH
jgi:hypothetical protein